MSRVIQPIIFACCLMFCMPLSIEAAIIEIVTSSSKHSDWDNNLHWLEIQTERNIYRHFLDFLELSNTQKLTNGEKISIDNKQYLFHKQGFISFDLHIPRLNETIVVEKASSSYYKPKNKGEEVHAVFEANPNLEEKTISFKIENGEKYRLFFDDEQDLSAFQNAQEFEIFYEESLYTRNPLFHLETRGDLYNNLPLVKLGIKNLDTNTEYVVKADVFYKWQPPEELRHRVMTYNFIEHSNSSDGYFCWYEDFFQSDQYLYDSNLFNNRDFRNQNRGKKMMVLERIGQYFKVLNLTNGELYLLKLSCKHPDSGLPDDEVIHD